MPDTLTVHYSFTLPEIGGSADSWGTKLNANWTAIDTALKAVSDAAAAAQTTASAALPASSYTATDVRTKLLSVDGAGSGVDADLLDGIQAAAFLLASSYTAADVLAKLLTVDGAGSGIDADLLDGQQGSWYTDIVARLGYSPVNRAGDTFSGNVTINGALTVSGDITSSSDARLKRDILNLDGPAMLQALRIIRGARYEMAGRQRIGVIAQNVLAAGLPELVETDEEGMLSVNYGNLVAVVIAALLHMEDRLSALEAGRDAS